MAKKKKDLSWLLDEENTGTHEVQDANGNPLTNWDSVIAIKDLKVKWANDIKRGEVFKNIRLTDDPELIESGKMILRCEFFKKK